MIKAVLFDYGGVICKGGLPMMLSSRLAQNLSIPVEQAEELINLGFDRFKRGQINESEFWELLENVHGKPIALDQRDVWMHKEELIPIPEVIAFRDSLTERGMHVGVLSNVEPQTAQTIRDLGGYDGYHSLTLSCEEGYAKPDLEIYQIALQKIDNVLAHEVLFIDDQLKCLAPATNLGMQTVLAASASQLIADAARLIDMK